MTELYSLTEEHRARLPEWRDRWIANAMSTEAMTEDDRQACREAVLGLYAAAKLPAPKHIVFVPSPFVAAFAGGFAAARWHLSKTGAQINEIAATRSATDAATRSATDAATDAATYDATRSATYAATYAATRSATDAATDAATYDATRSATDAATYAATYAATDAATRSATDAATYAATDAATRSATDAATRSATDAATYDATRSATDADDYSHWYVVPGNLRRCADELGVGDFGLRCAAMAWRMRQGGNQWSAWDSFLTFFKDVVKLPLDYTGYRHWQTLSERSGPRIMHPDFCMISDRPAILKVDERNLPHCEDGPFCAWRDGTELYSWHGARIPARWIRERQTINPTEILREQDVELRAAGAACIGWPRMLSALDYRIIDADPDPSHGELIELTLDGLPSPGRFLKAECPRNGTIVEGVPLEIGTVLAAQAWRVGLEPHEFSYPTVRT
ncbi:DUF6745 domain-containing protein [Novosphingobium mangrovi (ex Huang et al. 2023)]|uniref:DUF6745 domain-containing protein n=1 Tax=Novosphingobium mangrovi (ex Huang et al. 2023) TaxID=2976432 RepID=A0ABT2I114_9SPHN|nr:hypothetical protein [Novosphingobium mangrovi (ex Huang et al. 2023)]MCT2398494.1 hypothetical protein [Novosphingobium mangrovi (ex Huang et al. 2023)]